VAVRATLFGVAVAAVALAGELLARANDPERRWLRGGVAAREEAGVVVWEAERPAVVATACAFAPPEAVHAVFVGGSVFRGEGLGDGTAFTELMRMGVDPGRGCVDNLAQPGFALEQEAATALAALRRPRPPDVLFWEVGVGDAGRFHLVGGTVVEVASGMGGAWIPSGLHGALLARSAAWRWLWLGAPSAELPPAQLAPVIAPVVEAARAVGTELVLVIVPPLDRSPRRSAADRTSAEWQEAADALGVASWSLDEALIDAELTTLRLDACCRFSAEGHRTLAEIFAGDLRRRMVAAAHGW
jgi:hypothetical protein